MAIQPAWNKRFSPNASLAQVGLGQSQTEGLPAATNNMMPNIIVEGGRTSTPAVMGGGSTNLLMPTITSSYPVTGQNTGNFNASNLSSLLGNLSQFPTVPVVQPNYGGATPFVMNQPGGGGGGGGLTRNDLNDFLTRFLKGLDDDDDGTTTAGTRTSTGVTGETTTTTGEREHGDPEIDWRGKEWTPEEQLELLRKLLRGRDPKETKTITGDPTMLRASKDYLATPETSREKYIRESLSDKKRRQEEDARKEADRNEKKRQDLKNRTDTSDANLVKLANDRQDRSRQAAADELKKKKDEEDRLHKLNQKMLEDMRNKALRDRLKKGQDPGQYLYDI